MARLCNRCGYQNKPVEQFIPIELLIGRYIRPPNTYSQINMNKDFSKIQLIIFLYNEHTHI